MRRNQLQRVFIMSCHGDGTSSYFSVETDFGTRNLTNQLTGFLSYLSSFAFKVGKFVPFTQISINLRIIMALCKKFVDWHGRTLPEWRKMED